jgi:4-amino-4-deoxy-L-arabinose transferase-like glycosyltransferase
MGALNGELVLVAALTVAAAALRFSTLDVQSFWHDEAVTAHRIIRHSLFATIGKVPGSESTPPLYYVLAWAWTRVFGISEVGLRSLSALIGTATVPVAYLAARTLTPRRAPALATCALAAVSPVLVWYSQEARAYVLLVLLGALSFLFFIRALQGGERRDLVWWAVVSALALCAHYFAVFVVLAEVVWLLRSRVRGAVPAVACVAIVGAALLPLAIHQANQGHTSWISSIPLRTRAGDLLKEFVIGPSGSPTVALSILAGVLVAGALVLLALKGGERERLDARPPLIVGGVALLLPLALAIVGLDYFFPRNLIAAWLPLAALVGLGCGLAAVRRVGAALAAALCCTLLAITISVNFNDRLQRPDWRGVAHTLGPVSGTRAVITPATGDDPLEYYLPGAGRILRRHATVGEVDLVGWPLAGKRPPRLAGFQLFASERVKTFTLYRYRSPQPRLVSRATLLAHHLGSEKPAALTQGVAP